MIGSPLVHTSCH